jgi:D-threonate/D-erythronate kinase
MNTDHQPGTAILAYDLTRAADGAASFVVRGLTASIQRRKLPPPMPSPNITNAN